MPGALQGGPNGLGAAVEPPRERSRGLLGFHLVLGLAQAHPPRLVRPRVLPGPPSLCPLHVETATHAGRPAKQIGRMAHGRGRRRFSVSRDACINPAHTGVRMCVVAYSLSWKPADRSLRRSDGTSGDLQSRKQTPGLRVVSRYIDEAAPA